MAILYIYHATRVVAHRMPSPPTHIPMLPRRNSTNPTTDRVSPRPGSGSTGGRRPLSLIATQQVFRASAAFTVETESPISEASPQESLPPPRPASFSRLPPANSGLRRQSVRRNSHETFRSALEDVPSGPPSMPTATLPVPQISEPPPPTQAQPQQLTPEGGVGGFASTAPPYRGHSHHSTANYDYRFHTIPSPRSDSDPPHYESADLSGGVHANVWPTYNKISREFDERRLAKWNTDLDVLLIFVSTVVRAGC